jgi:Cu-Zn family superoxide dismutase
MQETFNNKRLIMLKKSLSSKLSFSCLLSSSLLALLVTSCACTDNRKPEAHNRNKDNQDKNKEIAQVTTLQSPKAIVNQAIAHVHGYQDKNLTGAVIFTEVPEGIQIVADVDGLKPGKHGFHVHEHGDCSGTDGMKAGGHFNPTNSKHGGPDSPERHVGDFGNLVADEKGHAHYDRVDKLITFEGSNSILDKSIIIHVDPDDYVTQPTGNAGARIACGKIEAITDQSASKKNDTNKQTD